jgi:hypothetical protein
MTISGRKYTTTLIRVDRVAKAANVMENQIKSLLGVVQ